MCVTICGRFCLNEGGVVGYVNWMKAKSPANWDVQIAGMIFKTRSNSYKLIEKIRGEELEDSLFVWFIVL